MPSRLLVPILSPSRVLLCGVAAGGEGCHARGVAASPRLLPRDRQRLQIPLSVTTAMLRRVHEQVCSGATIICLRDATASGATIICLRGATAGAALIGAAPSGVSRGGGALPTTILSVCFATSKKEGT